MGHRVARLETACARTVLAALARRQLRKSAAAEALPPPRQQRGSISPAIFTAESD
jgi:hypothetical protein